MSSNFNISYGISSDWLLSVQLILPGHSPKAVSSSYDQIMMRLLLGAAHLLTVVNTFGETSSAGDHHALTLPSTSKPYTRWWWFASEIDSAECRDQLDWLASKALAVSKLLSFIHPVAIPKRLVCHSLAPTGQPLSPRPSVTPTPSVWVATSPSARSGPLVEALFPMPIAPVSTVMQTGVRAGGFRGNMEHPATF